MRLLAFFLFLSLPLCVFGQMQLASLNLIDIASLGRSVAVDVKEEVNNNPKFVIGRDNLGFANPHGSVSVAKMAGNCYTVSLVTRIFFEHARYHSTVPEGKEKGFKSADIARALRAKDPKDRFFDVYGYKSLLDLTYTTKVPSHQLDEWAERMSRQALGIDPAKNDPSLPENTKEIVEMYKLITTIHYLHYMQNQAQHFLKNGLDDIAGKKASEITLEAVQEMSRQTANGELPLLLIFNPRIPFGHVVLNYRVENKEEDPHYDVYICDSNYQYGPHLDESILRVDKKTGLFSMYKKSATDGKITASSTYSGSSWFNDKDHSALIVLPNPNGYDEQRAILADKLDATNEETGYIMAVGDYIKDVTTQSPQTSSLFKDTRKLLVAMQNVQISEGVDSTVGSIRLNSTISETNAYLKANTDQAIRTVFPYALPQGIELKDTSLLFDSNNENRAQLQTTIILSRGAEIDRIVEEVSKSTLFANDNRLGEMVTALNEAFENEKLTAKLKFRIEKEACPVSTLGKYAPMPILLSSHIIVGDMASTRTSNQGDHYVEISESVLQKSAKAALESLDIIGHRQNFDYSFTLGSGYFSKRFTRKGYVQLNSLKPECSYRGLTIAASYHGFAPVATSNSGVSFSSRRFAGTLRFSRPRGAAKNEFTVSSSLYGTQSINAGLGPFDSVLVDVLGSVGEFIFSNYFADTIENIIEKSMKDYVVLSSGSSVEINSVSFSSSSASCRLAPLTIDVGASVKKLLGDKMRAEVIDIKTTNDRLILVLDND